MGLAVVPFRFFNPVLAAKIKKNVGTALFGIPFFLSGNASSTLFFLNGEPIWRCWSVFFMQVAKGGEKKIAHSFRNRPNPVCQTPAGDVVNLQKF